MKSKNVVNKGRVEKITLATKGNEGAVKKFLYKRDGKVTFAFESRGAGIGVSMFPQRKERGIIGG